MKTDKFEESIRKKLEDLDPPFQENNWLQLRSFLRRNGVPSIGMTTTQWLVPMLSAASVAGLLILAVWQYRTNQTLTQTVQTLTDSVTLLQQVPLEAPVAVAPKTDTVYITREVMVPKLIPASPPYQPDERTTVEQSATETPETIRREQEFVGEPARLPKTNGNRYTERGVLENRNNSTESGRRTTERESLEQPSASAGDPSTPAGDRGNRTDERRYSGRQKPNGFEPNQSLGIRGSSTDSDNSSGTAADPGSTNAISWEPVLLRKPTFDSSYYAENYQRRIRRIRLLPTSSGANASAIAKAAAPAQQPAIENPAPVVRFRIGAGGELAGGQSGFGLSGEVLLGEHLIVGLGVTRLSHSGDVFLSDLQYFQKRKSDFRRDYLGKVPVDPRIEIRNITQRAKSWQLPLTVAYRLPLGNSFSILPTAGVSLGLGVLEEITYAHRKAVGYPDFFQRTLNEKCPPNLYNSWTASLGLEKQVEHWGVQITPYLSSPLLSTRHSLNQTTAGVRMRILYQF
ncbi:hypothetical protein GCM10027347_24770 [Larkinella harenae]